MTSSRRIDLVLLAVAAVWGASYLAAKVATGAAPVLVVLFLRYGLSAAACVALGGVRCRRDEYRIGALLGLTQAAILVLETYGVAHTSAANAGLIISLTIVLTPLFAGPRRLPPSFYVAATGCVIGVGLLMSATGLHAPRVGDLLMLGAAGVRAAHVALLGRLTTGRDIRPLRLTTIQTIVGTAVFALAAAPRMSAVAHIDLRGWLMLAFLALFCSVFAFLAQTWAVQRTSASRASLLLGTEPVWAVAVGVIIGGEHLTVLATVGAVLVVAGAYRGQSIERAHRPVAVPVDHEVNCTVDGSEFSGSAVGSAP